MISLLPPKLIKVLEFAGFGGNRSLGILELRKASCGISLFSTLSSAMLLFHHTVTCTLLGMLPVHAFTRTRSHTYTLSHVHAVTRIRSHTYTQLHVYVVTRTRSHTYTQSHIHTVTRTRSHTYTQSHVHAVTRTRSHMYV